MEPKRNTSIVIGLSQKQAILLSHFFQKMTAVLPGKKTDCYFGPDDEEIFVSIGRRPFLEQMLFGQERKLQFFSFKVFSIKKQKTDRSLNCLASFLFLPFLPKVIFWPSWATFYQLSLAQ